MMNIKHLALGALLLLAIAPAATADNYKDVIKIYDLDSAVHDPKLAGLLPAGVKYYFGDNRPVVKTSLGMDHSNKKGRQTVSGRSAPACRVALIAALTALGEKTKMMGGNAVIGIKSTTKGQPEFSSTEEYQCRVGTVMTAVTLSAELAVVE